MPNNPTIQKPYCRQFPELTMAGFTDALRPDKFTGVHFKRWQYKAELWLTTMKVFHISKGKPEGTISDEDQKKFEDANTVFVGCILSILADRLCDVFMHIKDGKELWDALDAKFGAADAGSELYIMESFHDFKMTKDLPVVQQAHEIQCIAKELELLKCTLPDKFVAGCIIAKLPHSWRNFATTLKHKRQEISVENLIASLDVEEKARAKDTTEKGEGLATANFVQKGKSVGKNKENFKPSFNKPVKTTTFKKKKTNRDKSELSCYTCGEPGHFFKDCPERADRRGKKAKTVNVVTASNTDGSLLDSVEMKLWEPVDTTKHKRDLMGVEDKVSKVEKERDATLALKAKAEQELTQARKDLHQAKVLQFTTTSIDKCMRKDAEKQLKLCKEHAKRKELTIRPLLSQEDAHRAKIRKIKEMCVN
uniref:Uncharacterized protein n=1 Tax=Avena sativa TaxID=4498 RepID=A0ACD6A1F3_AVESA